MKDLRIWRLLVICNVPISIQIIFFEKFFKKYFLDQSGETDEEPDVDDIEISSEENVSNCVNDNISKVLEVYDEETCLETMRGTQGSCNIQLIILGNSGYYETAFEKKLPETCKCFLQGCEFDPLSNTYRLQVKYSFIFVTIQVQSPIPKSKVKVKSPSLKSKV